MLKGVLWGKDKGPISRQPAIKGVRNWHVVCRGGGGGGGGGGVLLSVNLQMLAEKGGVQVRGNRAEVNKLTKKKGLVTKAGLRTIGVS